METRHRVPAAADPEVCARAALMVDGARLPLTTVAASMGVPRRRAAHLVAIGRIQAVDPTMVLRRGCGPHLGGLVTGAPSAVQHVHGCADCRALQQSMALGVHAARARWTGQAMSELLAAVPAPPPVVARPATPVPTPPVADVPPVVPGVRLSASAVLPFRWTEVAAPPTPPPPARRTRWWRGARPRVPAMSVAQRLGLG